MTKKHILCVGDIKLGVLRTLNVTITNVKTSQQAQDILLKKDYCLVIINIVLPDENGYILQSRLLPCQQVILTTNAIKGTTRIRLSASHVMVAHGRLNHYVREFLADVKCTHTCRKG